MGVEETSTIQIEDLGLLPLRLVFGVDWRLTSQGSRVRSRVYSIWDEVLSLYLYTWSNSHSSKEVGRFIAYGTLTFYLYNTYNVWKEEGT